MVYTYPAIFYKEENGYTVVFPDLDHLATCGSDLEEATYMAKDCLQGHIMLALEDNKTLPKATAVEDVDPFCEDWDFVVERFVRNVTVDTDDEIEVVYEVND